MRFVLWWSLLATALVACSASPLSAPPTSASPGLTIVTSSASGMPAQPSTPAIATATPLPASSTGSAARSAAPSPSTASVPSPSATASPLPSATGLGVVIAIPTPAPSPASTPSFATPFFANGSGYGNCTSGLTVTAIPSSATVAIVEPGYFGAFTAQSSAPATAQGSVVNALLTILAERSGSATIKVSDLAGDSNTCSVTVL